MDHPASELCNTWLYTAELARALDKVAIEGCGIPGIQLMKRAGREVFNWLKQHYPAANLHVFCGAGNNGGDGYIVAALAKNAGWPVSVYWLSDPGLLKGDAQLAYQFACGSEVPMQPFDDSAELQPGVVIDALLGTGLSGSPRENYLQAIRLINQSGCPVVAVDVPSGLSADTGMPLGEAVCANATVTFIGIKQGLVTGQGRDYCGELVFSDLGVPDRAYQQVEPSAQLLDLKELIGWLPPRNKTAHKGNSGHLLIVGGDQGMGGAIMMAAEAALRTGAGLVSVATQPVHVSPALSRIPEAMVAGVEHSHQMDVLLDKADVVVVGPGLGQSAWSEQLLQKVLQSGLSAVIDADALNLISGLPADSLSLQNCLITPHPGEAGRLLDIKTAEVQADRFETVELLQQKFSTHVLLKGAGTLTCCDRSGIGVCPYGNPGMAVGGMGDVLSGILGGLMAQGLAPSMALELGVCLHSKAADIASEEGERGLLPTDVFPVLRRLVNGELSERAGL